MSRAPLPERRATRLLRVGAVVNQEPSSFVPDPSATIPFRRDAPDGSLEPTEPTPMPARKRRTTPRAPQFSAVSFALGLFAGITLTSAVAGIVFTVMMMVG